LITAKQHIPGFAFDPRDEPPPLEHAATIDALLEIRWIKSWREHPKFFRYVVSRDYSDVAHARHLLMVELDGGRTWWVLAFLTDDPILSELPDWDEQAHTGTP